MESGAESNKVARAPDPEFAAGVPILFLDGEALVVDKPAGLAVHPGSKTAESFEDRLDDLRFGFARPPRPVHRLDRDTSGCLLLARNRKAHVRFSLAFSERLAEKVYVAIVDGALRESEGRIDLPIAKISSPDTGWRMIPDPGGQKAVTRWYRLAERDGRTLLLFRPETGRTHQIRVHAASGLGAPILGDPIYGGATASRTMLHALALVLPRAGKPAVRARAALPPDFLALGFCEADVEGALGVGV